MNFHWLTVVIVVYNLLFLTLLTTMITPPLVLLVLGVALLGTVVLVELQCRQQRQDTTIRSEIKETIDMLVKFIYFFGIFTFMAVYQFYFQYKTKEELSASFERYVFVITLDSDSSNATATLLFYGANFALGVCEVAVLKRKADLLAQQRNTVLKVVSLRSQFSEGLREECSICLSPIKMSQRFLRLHCDHEFHFACLRNWVVKTSNCPLCRKAISQ